MAGIGQRLYAQNSNLNQNLVKGWIVGVQVPPIVIVFHLNPERIQEQKHSGWVDFNRFGQLDPANRWYRGGAKIISFVVDLDSKLMVIDPTGLQKGVEMELAKYESLSYSKFSSNFSTFAKDIKGLLGFTNRQGKRFKAPPKVIFGFGISVLECVVKSLSVEKIEFNKWLSCTRAKVSLQLQVSGDSVINQANDTLRVVRTTAGSAVAAVSYIANLLGSV